MIAVAVACVRSARHFVSFLRIIGWTGLFVNAAMPFPTEYPTIIVIIGSPWSWSIAPTAIKTVMQIRATRAIKALEGLTLTTARCPLQVFVLALWRFELRLERL
jgi:hypothetical protein